MTSLMRGIAITAAAAIAGIVLATPAAGATWSPPPVNAGFDYQIGGDYPLPSGASIVSRDWFHGSAGPGAYSICYVNALQTQADDAGVDRPDEKSNWPQDLVLAGGRVGTTGATQRAQAVALDAGLVPEGEHQNVLNALVDNRVIAIEYRRRDFRRTCNAVGRNVSVVLRDRNVTTPNSPSYRHTAC